MQTCILPQSDNHANIPPLKFSTGRMPFLLPNQQHQSTEGEWLGAGMVICLRPGADLHIAQLMPLPLTISCFSKIQIGSGTGSPR